MSKSIVSVSFFFSIIVLVSLPRKRSHNLQHIKAIPFSYLSSDMLLNFFFTCDICFLEDLTVKGFWNSENIREVQIRSKHYL